MDKTKKKYKIERKTWKIIRFVFFIDCFWIKNAMKFKFEFFFNISFFSFIKLRSHWNYREMENFIFLSFFSFTLGTKCIFCLFLITISQDINHKWKRFISWDYSGEVLTIVLVYIYVRLVKVFFIDSIIIYCFFYYKVLQLYNNMLVIVRVEIRRDWRHFLFSMKFKARLMRHICSEYQLWWVYLHR